jgi:4-diphosphocytidyl-2-C-methyl-D-erythritol kinase
MADNLRVRAFAKINLSLRILGVRSDGYHELRTIFQSIALHDTLTVRRIRGPFALVVESGTVAADRTNLVWRAAHGLWKSMRRRGAPRGAAIHLVKRIPLQAGLGGGSSDAAAALRALARLWRADPQCVREAAVRLGADVPFFLEGGTVLGLERGDVLYPLLDRPRAWVVLVLPPFGVSTPDAYRWWDEWGTEGGRRRDGGDPVPKRRQRTRERTVVVLSAIRGRRGDGGGTEVTPSPIEVNDLQAPVAARQPTITRIVRDLTRAGARLAAMSGSGSAVFGLFPTRAAAERAARAIGSPTRRALVTRTLTRAEYQRLAGN